MYNRYNKRAPQKKLSMQLTYNNFSQDDDSFEEFSCTKPLPPTSLVQTGNSSEEESEIAINSILNSCMEPSLPEFESPIKTIKENFVARSQRQQAKKNILKAGLITRLKHENFSRAAVLFKDTFSVNTASTSNGIEPACEKQKVDESLVNLDSEDEHKCEPNRLKSEKIVTGNSGMINLILKQATLLNKNRKYKKNLIKNMLKTNWTDWFMIGFKEFSEEYALYGRKSHKLLKVAGTELLPDNVEFSMISNSFKYDWVNQRFKPAKYCWDSDAIIIRTI